MVKNQFMLKSDQSTNYKERIGIYTTTQIQKDGELVAKIVWLLVKMLETITMPVRIKTVKLLAFLLTCTFFVLTLQCAEILILNFYCP